MREVKFDAIYKPTGEHFNPYELNFNDNTVTYFTAGTREKEWCHFSFDGKYGDVILRQYTGLKDKNGKEIYEGDILFIPYKRSFPELGSYKHVVTFKNGYFSCSDYNTYQSEIVGNKFEHPSLLEESQ